MERLTSYLALIAAAITKIGPLRSNRALKLATLLTLCSVAASAQVIVILAFTLARDHIALAPLESARAAVMNRCRLPIELELLVTPYPPNGVASPDYAPYTIPVPLAPGELKSFVIPISPIMDGVSHADVELLPGPRMGPDHACFAPGQDLIQLALTALAADGSVRHIKQLPVALHTHQDPPSSAPRDRVFQNYRYFNNAPLVPLATGDRLQLAIPAGNCAGEGILTIFDTGTSQGQIASVDFTLEPGANRVVSSGGFDTSELVEWAATRVYFTPDSPDCVPRSVEWTLHLIHDPDRTVEIGPLVPTIQQATTR